MPMSTLPPPAPLGAQPPEPALLRAALGRYATGVTLVTCLAPDGHPVGLTVNSFAALSLAPPLVLWSLRQASALLPMFEAAEHFAVSVLGEQHQGLSRRFSSPEPDKFAQGDWRPGLGGAPVLADALAHLECALEARHVHGDHVLYIGRVLRLSEREGAPLLYQASRYRALGEPI